MKIYKNYDIDQKRPSKILASLGNQVCPFEDNIPETSSDHHSTNVLRDPIMSRNVWKADVIFWSPVYNGGLCLRFISAVYSVYNDGLLSYIRGLLFGFYRWFLQGIISSAVIHYYFCSVSLRSFFRSFSLRYFHDSLYWRGLARLIKSMFLIIQIQIFIITQVKYYKLK